MTQTPQPHSETLRRAKMELVAAQERGDSGALALALARHPAHATELVDFATALVATSGHEQVALTAETEAIAERARSRAFAAVFGAAPVAQAAVKEAAPQAAVVTLKGLRQARKLSMREVAQSLGLGVDVLSSLEAGRIRAATVPERLTRALADLLRLTADRVRDALSAQPALSPAMLRSKAGERKGNQQLPAKDFAEMVRNSPEMSADDKARWLDA